MSDPLVGPRDEGDALPVLVLHDLDSASAGQGPLGHSCARQECTSGGIAAQGIFVACFDRRTLRPSRP
jgi:hypothetical protein